MTVVDYIKIDRDVLSLSKLMKKCGKIAKRHLSGPIVCRYIAVYTLQKMSHNIAKKTNKSVKKYFSLKDKYKDENNEHTKEIFNSWRECIELAQGLINDNDKLIKKFMIIQKMEEYKNE